MSQSDLKKDVLTIVDENALRAGQMVVGRDALFLIARALFENKLGATAKVLVVGSGWGDEIFLLGKPNPGWQFVGVDLSEEMLKLARARVAAGNLPNKVELHQTDVRNLNDENFNAATCILTLHFVPDDGAKLALLQAIRQRLRTGAPFFLVDALREKNEAAFQENIQAWSRHAQNNGCPPEAIEKMAEHTMTLPLVTEERETELLREAGFAEVRKVYQGIFINGWLCRA
jgi:tRNA (cmo5U34)-methyltransferase